MTEANPIQILLTPEFQRKVRNLAKKYRHIRSDLQPILEQLQAGNILGAQISGIGYEVFKLRIKNSDIQKGKSGGYRLIYWLRLPQFVVLLDIYSKSEQEDIEVMTIQQIISRFNQQHDRGN